MAGFHLHWKDTPEGREYMWFLDIGGSEDAIASSYKPTFSEEDAVKAIARLMDADLASLDIILHDEGGEREISR